MTHLITGGSGFLGNLIARRLHARGERVRVLDGPLAGVEGMFVHDKPSRGRLVVSVDMLGRSIAVEMDAAGVEPCPSAQPMVPGLCERRL